MLCESNMLNIVSTTYISLNPCFNGICSAREWTNDKYIIDNSVLILVLMEYALRVGQR